MSAEAALHIEPAPIVACTVSKDIQDFDLLIDDMETKLGETWGDLGFEDTIAFLDQPDAKSLEFLVLALADEDEAELDLILSIVTKANDAGVKLILVTDDISPSMLHRLMKGGVEEFLPYPLPDGELGSLIDKMRQPPEQAYEEPELPTEMRTKIKAKGDRDGVVLPVHGLAGGTGSTTLAVNLAWELSNIDKANPPRVCLLDLDLQFGEVATYLDLPRREAVFELLSDTESMDSDSFCQALLSYNEVLHVLTAPSDILPLDLIGPEDVQRIIEVARTNFDYVVIDMPSTLVSWTETVLEESHVYFSTMELDMRSAQNTLRMIRALKSEELPVEKLRFALNRAPKFTDLSGKARVKRLAESLDIKIELLLPDGGKPIAQACDQGLPLASGAAKSPLRKEILKLAGSVHEINLAAENAA
ncbi:AAA family ATPase [Cochlodiniinecator piscidefendens]|uniref:AAA family ATPase n=1 Tax=Cochlodiniinecator piscidefendens TaxID=2715756 RepID=UPI00140C9962|nr:AAA family ATPase [Cochlodiniinecator piscidefendens]